MKKKIHNSPEEAFQHFQDFAHRRRVDCPRCGDDVTALRKTGRSVYARPCGCRLWQGEILPVWDQSPS